MWRQRQRGWWPGWSFRRCEQRIAAHSRISEPRVSRRVQGSCWSEGARAQRVLGARCAEIDQNVDTSHGRVCNIGNANDESAVTLCMSLTDKAHLKWSLVDEVTGAAKLLENHALDFLRRSNSVDTIAAHVNYGRVED